MATATNRYRCECAICGKVFWSCRNHTNTCSVECKAKRRKFYNSEAYRRRREVGERMTEGEVARMMRRYHLKKHDDAVAASGYAPKVEVRVAHNASGRLMRYESRGRIPAGGAA